MVEARETTLVRIGFANSRCLTHDAEHIDSAYEDTLTSHPQRGGVYNYIASLYQLGIHVDIAYLQGRRAPRPG